LVHYFFTQIGSLEGFVYKMRKTMHKSIWNIGKKVGKFFAADDILVTFSHTPKGDVHKMSFQGSCLKIYIIQQKGQAQALDAVSSQ
jgi:sorbitol-specific phosphotransferase system component IIA